MSKQLTVQINNNCMGQPVLIVGHTKVMITPLIFVNEGEAYWWLRVELSDEQALVAFPKFGTIGIGFEHETDWNTNLPYTCPSRKIYHHIRHNKGDKSVHWTTCMKAIELLQKTIAQLWSEHSEERVKKMHDRYFNELGGGNR